MKTIILTAAAACALGMAAPAIAQEVNGAPPIAAGAVSPGDAVVHSSTDTRIAAGNKNNVSQDGNTTVGGGSMAGPQTTTAQGFGAAAGGSTGGTKSEGR